MTLESWSSSPSSKDYELTVDVVFPEDCSNGVDDDHDGFTDCEDSEDCCQDATCAGTLYCGPYQGYWEQFTSSTDAWDLEGYTIQFTPDATAPEGYTWSATGGVTDYPIPPGTGDASAVLVLGDDDAVAYDLTIMPGFPYYGKTYTTIFVSSNGYVTFHGPEDRIFEASTSAATDFMTVGPAVAPVSMDLNPTSGGTITVDEFPDKVVVTYDHVRRYSSTDEQSVQLELRSDGTVVFTYKLVEHTTAGLVAITAGWGTLLPPETNFVP